MQHKEGNTQHNPGLLLLSNQDVERTVSYEMAIAAVEDAFRQLWLGEADVPLRTHIDVPEAKGVSLFMPARLSKSHGLGIKIVSVRPQNSELGLDNVPATIFLIDDETGMPLALMEASYLTVIRTAAGSAVATRHLARADASYLLVYGAGEQAGAHIQAIQCVRKLTHVSIVNRTIENAEKLKEKLAQLPTLQGIQWAVLTPGSTDEVDALHKADIIVTATNSYTPVFDGKHLKPGVHINCVGSYKPTMQEVDCETVVHSKYVADSAKQVLNEAGDITIPIEKGLISSAHVIAEIGQVIAGHKVRSADTDRTIFKSVGNAVQDVAVAQLVYKQAKEKGFGRDVHMHEKAGL